MKNFDPNAASPADAGIFGLPFSVNDAKLILIPVPWEATTSYGGGTSKAPQSILRASKQIDLFDLALGNFFEAGIAMLDESTDIQRWNAIAKKAAQQIITEQIDDPALINQVNECSLKVNDYVYRTTHDLLSQNKCVGVVGGDHSSPFGAIQAFLGKYPQMSILHFDAHADLRNAFEGFEHSHASIMYNVMTKTPLATLVQVGIRDFCEEEFNFIQNNKNRITTFFDSVLSEQKMQGKSWSLLCDEIIKPLSNEVYVSFDIDGLDPRFCPHTGTPVPGGLDFFEALFLLNKVIQSGRKLIGFDLNEVSPGNVDSHQMSDPASEWDANVGARLLYKLCGWTLTQN